MTSLAYGLGTASWDYLANGLLARQTLPNGAWTDYAYDGANRIRQLINKDPAGAVLAAYGDTDYLPTGDLAAWTAEVTGQANQSGSIAYDYDRKRRLIEETSTRLGGYDFDNAFDEAGNALEFRNDPHTYNADNQLVGPGTYVYDGNGNPTTWDGTALTWNVENRMTAYGTALTAGYRGDGLRAWKQPGGGNQTYFLYDGISVLCELDDTGAVSASSTYGANGLLSRGTTEYQFDPLGDAVLLLDGTGAVTARQVFDGWGNALTGATGPHGYRAERNYFTDLETGLIALGFRLYSTDAGRLLQRDPIGLAIGANQYWYADANPVLHIDPLGLLSDLGTVVILGLVGAAAAAITDFCLQRLRCANTDLDWASIGISAVGGLLAGLGFGPSVIGAVGAAALNFIVTASRCGNIVANGGCFAEAGDAAFRSIIAGIGAGIVAEIAKALGKSGIAAIWGIVDILIGMTVACAGLLPWM